MDELSQACRTEPTIFLLIFWGKNNIDAKTWKRHCRKINRDSHKIYIYKTKEFYNKEDVALLEYLNINAIWYINKKAKIKYWWIQEIQEKRLAFF